MSECYCRECRNGNYQGCLSLPKKSDEMTRKWLASLPTERIRSAMAKYWYVDVHGNMQRV